MKKRLNKIPTNYSVALSEQEVVNLSETLSAVRTAGGGTGGVYIGDGQYIGVDNTNNRISFLPDAATKLESVSDKLDKSTYAVDSATFLTAHQSLSGYYQKTETSSKEQLSTEFEKYQTVAGMDQYLTEDEAQSTYLTKSNADTLYAPLSTTADIEALKAVSGDFSQYYKKTDTSSKEELSAEFDKYQTKADMNDYATDIEVSDGLANLELRIDNKKQDKLTFGYNENNAISSINDSALAGQGGTTYSAGQYINIDSNNTISVTGVLALDEYAQYEPVLIGDANITATSSKVNSHTQWNLAINSTPVVTDTKLVGENSITAHTTNVSGEWLVGLEQTAHNAIASIDGITTDVGTLKTASANWNEVSAKLDTTAFSTVSGTFLTTIPDTYATKEYANNASSNALSEAKTWVGQQGYIKQETDWTNTIQEASAKAYNDATANANSLYQTKGDYVKNTDIGLDANNKVTAISGKELIITAHQSLTNYYTKDETSGASELSDEFAKYVTSSTVTTQGTDYVMTTTGWKVLSLPGGGMTQVIHDDTLTGQGNSDNDKLGLSQTAYNAITSVSSKLDTTAFSTVSGNFLTAHQSLDNYYTKTQVDSTFASATQLNDYLTTAQYQTNSGTFLTKSSADNDYAPISITANVNTLTAASAGWNNKVDKPTSLNDKYLVLRTDNAGNVSGWEDLKNECYSKTEATGTFVATANIDTTTLSGDGKTVSTKLGVKTDVIATKDYVNSSFLPLSGGTVSGLTTISGSNFDSTLEVKRAGQDNNYAHIGLNNSRGLSFKAFDSNASTNVQLDILPNNSNSALVKVSHNDSQIGFLIPAVTATSTDGLTNDGILHIILES